jgi:hypothetical protein
MSLSAQPVSPVFAKDTLIRGKPARIDCVQIAGQTYSIARGALSVVRLEDEWFEEVKDPVAVIEALQRHESFAADILTFCQRLPNVLPKYPFHQEWESIAAIPIDTYDYWWTKQIDKATRNMVRKSQKLGVEVRECLYDDEFVRGMTAIFNETPIRQGRPFWHYGKDFDTVKRQFSRCLFREELIGAYYKNELVGFAMLGNAGAFADLGQIISKVEHRDKATTNALIAKCVELCAKKHLRYLVYAYWMDNSLGDFKRRSGFQEMRLPRYFVPLTLKGRLALRTSLHRGLRPFVPKGIEGRLRRLRRAWSEWREKREQPY